MLPKKSIVLQASENPSKHHPLALSQVRELSFLWIGIDPRTKVILKSLWKLQSRSLTVQNSEAAQNLSLAIAWANARKAPSEASSQGDKSDQHLSQEWACSELQKTLR